jgi:Tfp pilus assembly PilM family ATPase
MKFVSGDADARSVKIHDFAELPLPPGGMINGIITNEDVMAGFFAWAKADYALDKAPASLVVNNNSIQAKAMEIPPVSGDMALEFIRREYGWHGEGGRDDNVYDYAVLSPKGANGGVRILAVGVARELLESYRRVFERAGLNLKHIDVGLSCHIKAARFMPQFREGCVMLVFVDGRTVTLTLFENGDYVISNRYRLIHACDDPAITNEIGGNISSMVQFNKTQKDSAAISAAYVAGVGESHVNVLRSSLTYLGMDIQRFDMAGHISMRTGGAPEGAEGFDPGAYLLNIGDLLKM